MRREAVLRHNCRLKKYPNGKVHITCFSRDIFLEGGWEDPDFDERVFNRDTGFEFFVDENGSIQVRKKDKSEEGSKQYNLFDPREDNMRRAKGKIFDIALSNELSYMITLTLDGQKVNRYDPKSVIKPFSKWLNNMVTRKGLKYLIVPELHEDGAIHFHGLINDSLDFVDSETVKVLGRKKPIKISTAQKYGYDLSSSDVRTVYNISNFKLGFSSAVKIDNNVEAVSKYMTKYTCKNFQKIFGQSFFAGGDINRELPTYFIDLKYQYIDGQEFFLPNDLGSVKYAIVDDSALKYLLEGCYKYG